MSAKTQGSPPGQTIPPVDKGVARSARRHRVPVNTEPDGLPGPRVHGSRPTSPGRPFGASLAVPRCIAAARFHLLSYGLAVVPMFVGTRMLLIDVFKMPVATSLGVVAKILAATMVWSARTAAKGTPSRARDARSDARKRQDGLPRGKKACSQREKRFAPRLSRSTIRAAGCL